MEKEPYRPGLSQDKTLVAELKELQKRPNSLVFASLAERYRTKGLARQALEILEEGLTKHPEFAPALVVKARCCFDLRRYADCLEILEGVLRRNPENIKAEKLRAEVFQRLGQKQAAIGALTRVIGLVPMDREAHKALEELRNLNEARVEMQAVRTADFASIPPSPSRGELKDFEVRSIAESQIFATGVVPETTPAVANLKQDEVADSWNEEDEAAAGPFEDNTFATRTVAELYLRQGLQDKAKRVLALMLHKDASDDWARETLQKLSATNDKTRSSQAQRTQLMLKAQYLERLLVRVQSAKRASY